MLRLSAVDTFYGPIQALKGITLEVDAGEIVCLLGGNASGKSTTMKTILGIVRPACRHGRVRGQAHRRAVHRRDRSAAASRWCPRRAASSAA